MTLVSEEEERLTYSVIGAFFEVYNTIGFGLLEHLYIMALEAELMERGHSVVREVAVPIWYKRRMLGFQRLDMVVDGALLVETKSTLLLPRIASRQLYNYLKATQFEIGLLLHFGPEPVFHRLILRNDKKRNLQSVEVTA
jgi:GxxExxY protein